MGQIIDCTKNGLIIFSYEEDIERLEKMKEIYNSTSSNLTGAFYSDMISEIDLQINHCKECIKNLKLRK